MKFYLALVLGMMLPKEIHAAETPPPAETRGTVRISWEYIDELAEEARRQNPGLAAARARADAARANVGAVRTWEDPMIRFGGMGARRMMRAEDGDIIYGVEQRLPVFGKPGLARRLAEAELATEEASTEMQFQFVRVELIQALLEAAVLDRVVQTSEEDLVWLDTLLSALEQQYRAGQATQVDLLRAQTQRGRRFDQLRTDQNLLSHEFYLLNRVLNRPLHSRWPRLELPALAPPVQGSPELEAMAMRLAPELEVRRRQVREAGAATEVARRNRWPDLNVGVEARNFSGDGSFRQGMVFFSFNLPLGNAAKYRKDIEREEARKRSFELDLADFELDLRQEIHHLVIRIDAARRRALLYKNEIIPRAEQTVASTRAGWEAGRDLFRDLLDARRILLDAQVEEARAVAEQYGYIAELLFCCGLDFPGALPSGEEDHDDH